MHVYKQLLLPPLEYCSAIWDPHHQTSITKLEMIQHHAARFVLNRPWHRSNHNYDSITEMLAYLKWPSVQTRTIARLILLFKIVKKLLVIPNHCLPSPASVSFTCAQHPLKLQQLQSRISIYKYSFLPRTIIQWNCLTLILETVKNIVSTFM